MLTDTQQEIADIENGLYKIEDALHIADTVYGLMFHAGCTETAAGTKALSHAVDLGQRALAETRKRLAALKEKCGPVAA